jgi:uncharacterized membrane protein HdeD (DUF308 family)
MHQKLADAWSVLLLRGICNVLFALVAFLQPGLALLALVLVWGVYAVIDGALTLTTGIATKRGGAHHWSFVLSGICGLVAGLVACVAPALTLATLAAIISIWAIVRGALEVAAALWLRSILPRAWLLAISGATSLAFGGLLIFLPALGLMTLVYLAGSVALVFGILAIALAIHLRRFLAASSR